MWKKGGGGKTINVNEERRTKEDSRSREGQEERSRGQNQQDGKEE
jgi:hypothetical protein